MGNIVKEIVKEFIKKSRSPICMISLCSALGIEIGDMSKDMPIYDGFLSAIHKHKGDIYPKIYISNKIKNNAEKINFCLAYQISRYIDIIKNRGIISKDCSFSYVTYDIDSYSMNYDIFEYALDLVMPFNLIRENIEICKNYDVLRRWFTVDEFVFYRQMIRYNEHVKSKSIIGRTKGFFFG